MKQNIHSFVIKSGRQLALLTDQIAQLSPDYLYLLRGKASEIANMPTIRNFGIGSKVVFREIEQTSIRKIIMCYKSTTCLLCVV